MSKALLVYGTKTGCTRGIAEKIAETLVDMGSVVHVKPAEEMPDPSGYDAVLVGSGVRAGSWHGSVKTWVTANAEELKTRPTAFFTACLTMSTTPEKADEVRAYTDTLIAETGVEPVDIGLFPGMCVLSAFSLPERMVMQVMRAPQGDFRDYPAVVEWATDVAVPLGLKG